MGVRTTSAVVQAVLGSDYGVLADGSNPDLNQYIAAASNIVNQVVALAASLPLGRVVTLDSATQELIERWLAAHTYTQMDPTYTNKSTGGASAGFAGSLSGLNLDGSRYGQMAKLIDVSGALTAISKRQVAGGVYVGHHHHNRSQCSAGD